MRNSDIASLLEEAAELMDLHDENPFKTKSLQRAAQRIERLSEPLELMSMDELEGTEGIGKSIAQKIADMNRSGSFPELEDLRKKTPSGVARILNIKGLGPKKVKTLWKELGIESPGELLYACEENRLIELKGFGSKSQESIRQSVAFSLMHEGHFHYAKAEKILKSVLEALAISHPHIEIHLAGDMRRKCETVQEARLIIAQDLFPALSDGLNQNNIDFTTTDTGRINANVEGLPLIFIPIPPHEFAYHLWLHTGSDEHVMNIRQRMKDADPITLKQVKTEESIYSQADLPYMEPEWREGILEFDFLSKNTLPDRLIRFEDLRGTLHNHTTYSDGKNTLEEMAQACIDLGLEYFGVCDHSRTAVYAGGLSIESVKRQQEEIARLNQKLAPFHIFSGIESDILADGSLDYPDEILETFDFVVASVHSGLRMDKDKATERLIKAICNPYTRILGHPTGRLLLSREGYPIDVDQILDACQTHGVAIELNANPYRLDLDWRHLPKAIERGIPISINPDAHHTGGLSDMRYGVYSARKGFVEPVHVMNTLGLEHIRNWFSNRRKPLPG
ncbi:MAG: DNA polymerase/3'-5' exonuclease PolX [Bacteroidota bacterium]